MISKELDFVLYLPMPEKVKIYKPSEEEILKNVIDSFEVENIKISHTLAKETFKKVLSKIKKRKKL